MKKKSRADVLIDRAIEEKRRHRAAQTMRNEAALLRQRLARLLDKNKR